MVAFYGMPFGVTKVLVGINNCR